MLTNLDFLTIGQSWPPPSEATRLAMYRDNKLLYEGEHQDVFNDWYRILREDQNASLEIILNWPKRITTLFADLLFGEPPRFIAGEDDSAEQQAMDRIVNDNALATTGYEVAIDTSRFGDGLFKIRLDTAGKAIIEGVPPTIWFPVVNRNNIRDVQHHVLGWTFQVGSGDRAKTYLQVEIHERGTITHRIFLLEGGKIAQEERGEDFDPNWRGDEEQTGIPDFLVVPVSGMRTTDRLHGLDDYGDLISLIQEMEVRVAQISRILDKHASPKMYGPGTNIEVDPRTGARRFKAAGDQYYEVEADEEPPGYLTWDGQLEAAFKELDHLIKQFYIVSETSPAAFGQIEAGMAESGSALRRLMMAPLAKVNRIRLRFDPAMKQVTVRAAALERAKGTQGTPEITQVELAWRDGLPEDPMEAATVEQLRGAAGNASRYSQIKRLDGGSEASIHEEMDRIAEDEAASAARMPAMAPAAIAQEPPEGSE